MYKMCVQFYLFHIYGIKDRTIYGVFCYDYFEKFVRKIFNKRAYFTIFHIDLHSYQFDCEITLESIP